MDLLKKNAFILFDGGMGTQLQKRIPQRLLPEEVNLRYPQILEDIHREYAQAGADIITTNTFGANPYKLEKVGLETEPVIKAAVSCARKGAGDRLVALDVGPSGRMMEPTGDFSFEEAYESFRRQVVAGAGEGCDLILIETMSDLQEARCAVLAAKEHTKLPVFCTLTFDEKGRTMTGTDPRSMVAVLEGLGVDALGVNCSLGPDKLIDVVREILVYASVPVLVQPNAGMPVYRDGETSYDITKEAFTKTLEEMAEMGVGIFGGCCGTDPSYIRMLREALAGRTPKPLEQKTHTLACSYRNSVLMDGQITLVSENLLPHGNPTLMEAFLREDFRKIVSRGRSAKNRGAHVLDVRTAGLPGKDEKSLMVDTVKNIQKSLDIPLQLESRNPQVLDAALRIYNGKALVNGLDGTEKTLREVLPIVKKYGAAVVALTLDEAGPNTHWKKRVDIARNILKRAEALGIHKKDVIFDPMVLPAGTGSDPLDALKAVGAIKDQLGCKVLLGIGNVSYAMPRRALLNQTYLAMAMSWGMDALMLNMDDEESLLTLRAGQVLTGLDQGGMDYAAVVGGLPEPLEELDEWENRIYRGDLDQNQEPIDIDGEVCAKIARGLLAAETAYKEKVITLPHLRRSVVVARKLMEQGKKPQESQPRVLGYAGSPESAGLQLALVLAQTKGWILQAMDLEEVHTQGETPSCLLMEVPFGTWEHAKQTRLIPWKNDHPGVPVVVMGPGATRVDKSGEGLAAIVQNGSQWMTYLEEEWEDKDAK